MGLIKDFIKANRALLVVVSLLIVGFIFMPIVLKKTSEDSYCISCHIHPQADHSWLHSPHMKNSTGVVAHCVDCHLPPKEDGMVKYLFAKAKHGLKDSWSYMTKDSADINWSAMRPLEFSSEYVYKESCIACHENLFPTYLSDKGSDAHYKYLEGGEKKHCISCHKGVGHFNKDAILGGVATASVSKDNYLEATSVSSFTNFTERIPGTNISFNMVAVPEGEFKMGSPDSEQYRLSDEGPVRDVKVDRVWMAEIEVTWDEYLAFFSATASQGRKEAQEDSEIDGITGPTPPWGAPDQGWGKGKRPAITMSHHAAVTYCRWLSEVTGKSYRLPTEAEWEHAARGGTTGTYYFDGEPKDFEKSSFMNKIFGPDTTGIWSNTVYLLNSPASTQEPSEVLANPYGLKNMLGNVAEFCSDYYHPDIYSLYPEGVINNPVGPSSGTEHVVRGGSYDSKPRQLRVARRDFTQTKEWLHTDPQMPKSIWWYSDSKSVGIRVVCDVPDSIK